MRHHGFCGPLIFRSPTLQHVSCQRPWPASKSDQCFISTEHTFYLPECLVNRREFLYPVLGLCVRQANISKSIQLRAYASVEMHLLTKSIGNDQNIREDNCSIESKPPYGLQCDLGREIRCHTHSPEGTYTLS